MSRKSGGSEFPYVYVGLVLFLIVFWGAVCFGPPFMRDFMFSMIESLKVLFNV